MLEVALEAARAAARIQRERFGEPLEVAGMVSHSGWLNIETEDVADGLLRYPKGLQVSLHVDYLQKPFQRGIRIVGDMGWVEARGVFATLFINGEYRGLYNPTERVDEDFLQALYGSGTSWDVVTPLTTQTVQARDGDTVACHERQRNVSDSAAVEYAPAR